MILSSEELEILEYLKSWKGTPISMVEICRCAGGRRKFRESPHWAKGLMARLVEANIVMVNDRGHYRAVVEEEPTSPPPAPEVKELPKGSHTVGDNYFPADNGPTVVGGDYFPSTDEADSHTARWISPQMAEILKKSGKKFGLKDREE